MTIIPKQPTTPPMPNKSLGIEFELNGDYIYRLIPMAENRIYTEYREEVVMDKKTFIEAFEKWVRED